MSGIPCFYKAKIEFDEPNILEETIRKAKYLYEHNKGKIVFPKDWDDKKKEICNK